MIFRPELAKLIKQGKKSQTRRMIDSRTCRYRPGKAYALQPGRGKSAIGRITVTDVREERLGDISFQDARREGFRTTGDFFDYWQSLHGSVDLDLRVWVISFEPGDVTDAPRLLAARSGGSGGDYTSNPHLAMSDEGEAVSQAEQARFSHGASERDDQKRREKVAQGRKLTEQGLNLMRSGLEDAGRDVRRTVRAIEHHVASLDRKLGDAA